MSHCSCCHCDSHQEEHNHEHDHDHKHNHNHDHDHGSLKSNLIKIIPAAILFIVSFFLPEGWVVNYIILILAYLIVGHETIIEAVKDLVKEHYIGECFLMTLASVGAIAVGEVSEAVAVMLFYSIGEMLEGIANDRSRKSITALLDLHPDSVNIRQNGELVKVAPEEVKAGDTVIVLAGERIALDGKIIFGETTLDNSALTGESLPVNAAVGDTVFGGGINCSGTIEVLVEKEYHDSAAARILELVKEAQSKKAKAERFISRFARRYTLTVVALAAIVAFIFPIFTGYLDTFSTWFYRALVMLVVSCPCALVISVPLTLFAGVGCASSKGILIKGTNYIEQLSKLKTLALDKTGTITQGVLSIENTTLSEASLEAVAYAESRSTHPIAKAIVKHYGNSINDNAISETREIAGKGIISTVSGESVAVGNEALMHDICDNPVLDELNGLGVHVAINGKYAGSIKFADKIKDDSHKAVEELRSLGVSKIVMLTGDTEAVAEKVASSVGIDGFKHSLAPDDKVNELQNLMHQKNNVTAFVGDGINDAPVLSSADIGVAMGALGSDAAIESADVVLLDDKLSKLALAMRISRKTMGIVWQNIIFSLGAKILVMILGVTGDVSMWLAVFADIGVMIIAVLNALRALKSPK
ncbi:MAG: cadmium-translocating P-type ATPase [Oscillospiraceae bacterium]|nr:cadmium-translocating P-type ATPase [Oscillospiraceae bacterium]